MLNLVKPYFPAEDVLMPRIRDVIYSGYVAEGENVKKFEEEMGEFIGNKNCLALSSCTAALHLALKLYNVNAGDEVISTAMTAEPTNVAIEFSGAKVVWADVDPMTGLISPEDIEKKITAKTKAIMLVHYAGMVCDMKKINAISEKYGIPVIEDAAHAFDAYYDDNTRVGNSRNIVVFSFQAIKHLTTVDGGMIFFPNDSYIERAKELRWFGLQKGVSRLKTNIKEAGYKYNMNNVTAEIGRVQLENVSKNVEKYIENGATYDTLLKDCANVKVVEYTNESIPSYWLYTIIVDERREELISALNNIGVEASPLHKRNDLHQVFDYAKTDLPNLDSFYTKFLHLPCGWWVTKEDIEKICDVIINGDW